MVDILKFYGVQVKNSQSLARYDSYKLCDERSAQVCSLLLLENNCSSNNVGGVRKIFCAIMVPQSPIGLINAEIGALCRILGHANH